MTGLRPESDFIIEIATIVTDKHLEVLAEGPVIAVHQSDAILATMDDWNQKQHGGSGLTARVRMSTITTAHAERETLEFLRLWAEPGRSPMCGNSICQDRRFLARHMPGLERSRSLRSAGRRTSRKPSRRARPTSRSTMYASRSASSPTIASVCYGRSLARNNQVSTTVSGFNERLSMP